MSYLAVVPLVIYVALLDYGAIPHSAATIAALLVCELAAVWCSAMALHRRYVACLERQRRLKRLGRA